MSRPPVPPFTEETARTKVRLAEDAWNSLDPERVAGAYTADCEWRNRSELISGHQEIVDFLKRKWAKETEYRLVKELHSFTENRIAVRFRYEWRDGGGQWWRSYGNENWVFNAEGLMPRREASINDVAIAETERKFRWPAFLPRPADEPGFGDSVAERLSKPRYLGCSLICQHRLIAFV